MTKKLLNSKILLSLGFIALFIICEMAILEFAHMRQVGFSKIINVAGRQRMLSQRITLLLHESKLERESITHDLNLFNDSHQFLLKSIPSPSLLRDTSALSNHYQEVLNPLVAKFLNEANFLKYESKSPHLKVFTKLSKNEFLKELDTAVKLFEGYSRERIQETRVLTFALSLLSLIVIILSYILILAPLRDYILRTQKELEEREKTALSEAHFKSMFLANMSHELRTPLNGVLGVADLLASTPLSKDQVDYLKIINQSGETLLGVVNNILDLTKLELGQVELDEVIFSPKDLLESYEKSFQYILLSKGIDYQLELSDRLPPFLLGDKLRINQVLNNLIGNAIKFTSQGTVKVQAHYNHSQFVLSISDTGIGMTEDQKKNIFNPFSQADISTTRKFGGTGLGLTIVHEIVSLMNGEIACESQIGEGTTFTVKFPLKESQIPPYKREATPEGSFTEKNVLVVDDNKINLNLMVKVLERMKINVTPALGGEEAIEKAKEEVFDLIFMDYHMPNLDGIETTKIIRNIEGYREIPIIALTADVQDKTKEEVLRAGMRELISKPVRKAELHLLLKKYL